MTDERQDDQHDPILAALSELPTHDVDAMRTERTRARAHVELDRARLRLQRRRKLREAEQAVVDGMSPWVRWGEPAVVGVVALVYLGWAVSAINHLLG